MVLKQAGRVLILEFINADQFPGQINLFIPLIQGYLEFFGKPVRRLRFGLSAAHFFSQQSDEVKLSKEEMEVVEDVARDLRPDLVVTTHLLGLELRDLLAEHGPAAAIHRVNDGFWQNQSISEFGSIQALADSGAYVHIHELSRPGFRPGYVWEPGNARALNQERNNVYLVTGRGCGHLKSVASNPCYRDLPLPRDIAPGCAFCMALIPRDLNTRQLEWLDQVCNTPASWIRRQVQAIADTLAPDHLPNALILSDVERPEILNITVEAMADYGLLPRVKLILALRADRLLQLAPFLREKLGASGLDAALQMISLGIESFSEMDLLRFNKGTTTLTNLRAINQIKALEMELPGRFYYSGYQGISFILFTPWTTLPDLHLNIGLLRQLGLDSEAGNLLLSRLRIHPNLAIRLLAERDQVLIEEETDEVLILNRRKLFGSELPWRHLDPRVAQVSALALRLLEDPVLQRDPLYQLVQAVFPTSLLETELESPRVPMGPVHIKRLQALVEAAVEADGSLDDQGLLLRARAITEGWKSNRRTRWWRLGEQLFSLQDYLEKVKPLLQSQALPCLSTPLPWSPEQARDMVKAAVGDLPCGITEDPLNLDGERSRLFVARDQHCLDQAIEACWRLGNASTAEDRNKAAEDLALLKGLPGRDPVTNIDGADPWWVLYTVLKEPGLLPLGIEALALGELGLLEAGQTADRERGTLLSKALGLDIPTLESQAWIFHLNPDEGRELVCLPAASPNEDFLDYDPELIQAQAGALRAELRRGNRLGFQPGQIQLYQGEHLLRVWTGTVGILHPGRRWHTLEWIELALAALRDRDPTTSRQRTAASMMAWRSVVNSMILF